MGSAMSGLNRDTPQRQADLSVVVRDLPKGEQHPRSSSLPRSNRGPTKNEDVIPASEPESRDGAGRLAVGPPRCGIGALPREWRLPDERERTRTDMLYNVLYWHN